MRRLSRRINRRTSLCLPSFMALCCLCSGGGRERKSALCSAEEKVRAHVAQRTRLNLQHCARRLFLLILSVCTVPVSQFVSGDQAHSMCYIFFPIWEYVNYICFLKADITCDDFRRRVCESRLTEFEPECAVATMTRLQYEMSHHYD